jgi:hypothetical protein
MGPYTAEQINEYLAQGALLPTDYAWHEGLPDWVRVTEISGVGSEVAPPPFNPSKSNKESDTEKIESKSLPKNPADKNPCLHCMHEYDHANNDACPHCKLPEFLTSGKWKCPRCDAVDKTYQGTELVAKSGPRMSFEVAEGVHHSVGSSRVGRESVTKCKECDTILDYGRNYHPSKDEQKEQLVIKKIERFIFWQDFYELGYGFVSLPLAGLVLFLSFSLIAFVSGYDSLLEKGQLKWWHFIIAFAYSIPAVKLGLIVRKRKQKVKKYKDFFGWEWKSGWFK